MDLTVILGTLGATIILVGFLGSITGKLPGDNTTYLALNILGSALLVVYAALLSSIPFVVLNLVWTASALYELGLHLRTR
jgi:hypothetical protein